MSLSPRLNWAAAAILVAIAVLVSTGLLFEPDDSGDANNLRVTELSKATEDQDGLGIDAQPPYPSDVDAGDSLPCLTLEQLEGHPVLAQDANRYEAVTDSGPVIAAYRGLSEQELLDLSKQEDSAAMAVLGAMSVMRARNLPEEKAVSYLTLEDPELMTFTFTRPFSQEFIDHMAQARQWFYKAALHGRVMVLHRVGESLTFEQGGPVTLGWISEEEYDNLSSYEKTALYPSNVYNVLAYEIAPGLKSGPHGEILWELMPRTEQQQAIIDKLAEQFDRDLKQAGLPPIVVSKSSLPPMDDLLSLLCDSERAWLEKEREVGR